MKNPIEMFKRWLYWRSIRKEQMLDSEKYFKVLYGIDGKPIEKIPHLDKKIIKEWLERGTYEKVVITQDDLQSDLDIGDAMMQVYAYVHKLSAGQLRYGCYPARQDMIECESELNFERNIFFSE